MGTGKMSSAVMALLLTAALAAAEENPEALLAKVEALAAEGKALTALSTAYDYYIRHAHSDRAARLKPRMNELQREFLRGNGGEFRLHRVKRNETLGGIARRNRLAYEFLMRVNGISKPAELREGAQIKIVHGPFSLKVFLKERRAVVYLDGARIRKYTVAVGSPDTPTPTGDYKVTDKAKNPSYDYKDEHYGPGDPGNPAGTRWIRLKGSFGLHGTNEPESIGKAVSEGCIRFFNKDIEEVYDFLVPGSTVTVMEAVPGTETAFSEKGVQ